MSISINWGTRVIHVPKDDLDLIQASPEIREFDLDWFRLQLKDLEDDPEGMPFPDTHNHKSTTTISGATYAQTVEIINGYTVEFEDGHYTINCIGANHNVADVKVVNSVSLIVNNAAGLIVTEGGGGTGEVVSVTHNVTRKVVIPTTLTVEGVTDAPEIEGPSVQRSSSVSSGGIQRGSSSRVGP